MRLEIMLMDLLTANHPSPTGHIVFPTEPRCPVCNEVAEEVTYKVSTRTLTAYCFYCDKANLPCTFDLP